MALSPGGALPKQRTFFVVKFNIAMLLETFGARSVADLARGETAPLARD
jgi:hypothetical protein